MRWRFLPLLFLGVACLAQEAKTPDAPIGESTLKDSPVLLTEAGSKVLPMPSFHFSGISQCDADGNLYFNTARNFNDAIIMKLKHDGSYSLYVLPPDEPKDNYFVAYRVNSEGVVYILVHAGLNDKLYLYEFPSDSRSPARLELAIPSGLEPINFLIFPGGRVLLQGYFTEEAQPPERRGQNYLAQFSPSGKLLRDYQAKGSDEVAGDLKSHSWTLTASAAVARNGQGYLLAGKEILVLSAAGELIKKIQITPPDKESRAVNMFVLGSRILVSFFKKPEKEGPFIPTYELVDGETGKAIKAYMPSEAMGNALACFSNEGFTFIRFENRHVKLISAKP